MRCASAIQLHLSLQLSCTATLTVGMAMRIFEGYLIRWVQVPFFAHGSDLDPPHESAGACEGFIFHSWVTREYLKF
jgi:hypothetical protein